MKVTSIRCPNSRPHKNSKTKIEYPTCGHLLAVYDDFLYFRCPICKIFWKVDIQDRHNVKMEEVSKDVVMELTSSLRAVE